MNCPHFVRFAVVLPAVAIMLAGCANSSNSVANSNASANTASAAPAAQAPSAPPKQPQRFGAYGISTTGYNSNLSTMINSMVTGEDDEPETKVATATPAGAAPAPATGATPAAGAKTAAGASPAAAPAPGQPQVAQNQPPQEPPKSKAQIAEENVPGLYGAPRGAQKDIVHWLMESSKDDQ